MYALALEEADRRLGPGFKVGAQGTGGECRIAGKAVCVCLDSRLFPLAVGLVRATICLGVL